MTDQKPADTFQELASGSAVIFLGTLCGAFFAFLAKLLIARTFSPSTYGIFSLALTIAEIAVAIGTLGLVAGTARQIAYCRGQGQPREAEGIIANSLVIGCLVSGPLLLIIMLVATPLSREVFHEPGLAPALVIIAFAIPFLLLIQILVAVLRGFNLTRIKVLSTDLFQNILFILLILAATLGLAGFGEVLLAYVVSAIATCIFLVWHMWRKGILSVPQFSCPVDWHGVRSLLVFSSPLILVNMLNHIMGWMDTLMIAYYEDAAKVGLYNAALPVARYLSVALSAFIFLYMPMVSALHASNRNAEISRLYAVTTKWVSSAVYPFMIFLVLFPVQTLFYLFGPRYVAAAGALQILVLGYYLSDLAGPNGATYTAYGRTRYLMWTTMVTAALNFVLNLTLIPLYGINGAAAATAISIIVINVLRSVQLYREHGIHSLSGSLLKPVVLSSIIIGLLVWLTPLATLVGQYAIVAIATLILFGGIYLAALFATRSIDKEDIDLYRYYRSRLRKG